MLSHTPPMSNAERQRRFRASHPGYFGRYRTSARAGRAAFKALLAKTTAAMAAAEAAPPLPPPTTEITQEAPTGC